MIERQSGAPSTERSVILAVTPISATLVQVVFDRGNPEHDLKFDPRGAPAAFVTLRIDYLMDKVEVRIRELSVPPFAATRGVG
jgi:hypothetical protein